tara:strand:+ start:47029 stop:48048 length:1020 start_codon:yes stop_codon:yes gene_type:complete
MFKKFIEKIDKLITKSDKFVIVPHSNPDGDALGSCLALWHFLKKKNKRAVIISPTEYPSFLKWLPGEKNIINYNNNVISSNNLISKSDVIFMLDFNSFNRIEKIKHPIQKSNSKKVVIDHHVDPEKIYDLIYSSTNFGSTCEMLYNVLTEIDKKLIDKKISTCLYCGIMTDSGSFRFPNTTYKTHQIISDLLKNNIIPSDIHEKIYDVNSINKIKLLSKALSNIKRVNKINAVYMKLSKNELIKYNFQKGDSEGFVNFGLSIKGIILSVILIEDINENFIKMSFRSKGNFDVNKFARKYFNGGGHINAAGGKSYENIDITTKKLIEKIKENKDKFENES